MFVDKYFTVFQMRIIYTGTASVHNNNNNSTVIDSAVLQIARRLKTEVLSETRKIKYSIAEETKER